MGIKISILVLWSAIFASNSLLADLHYPWAWALFGVVLYNYLVFNISKDELDNSSGKFKFKHYVETHWDNWVWSLLCVPVIVIYGDQLFYYAMGYFGKDWVFYDVIYLSAGVLAEGLYYFLKKLMMLKKALK